MSEQCGRSGGGDGGKDDDYDDEDDDDESVFSPELHHPLHPWHRGGEREAGRRKRRWGCRCRWIACGSSGVGVTKETRAFGVLGRLQR